LEGLVGEALGGGAGGERTVGPVGFALAGAMSDCDARVGIGAEKADEGRGAEVHAIERLGAIDLFKESKLREQGFEVRAGEPVVDAADAAGQLEPAGMPGAGLKKTL